MISSETLTSSDDPVPMAATQDYLKTYVGSYKIGPDYQLVITVQGNHLEGRLNESVPFMLLPETTDVFFSPGQFGKRWIFKSGASGLTEHLVTRRAGHDLIFDRRTD